MNFIAQLLNSYTRAHLKTTLKMGKVQYTTKITKNLKEIFIITSKMDKGTILQLRTEFFKRQSGKMM